MFCRKCGFKMEDDVKFCPQCGTEVVSEEKEDYIKEASYSTNSQVQIEEAEAEERVSPVLEKELRKDTEADKKSSTDGENEKIGWKDFLTIDNIERFAPIAALLPIAMIIVNVVLSGIVFATIGKISLFKTVFSVIFVVLKILFTVATAGATGGLVYLIIKKKYISSANAWCAPLATLFAFFSCLGIALNWGIITWMFGVIAVLLGLELLPRVIIAELPITSSINPIAGIKTYKKYYADYKEKYPTTKDLERAGIEDAENSKFDGSGVELLGYYLLTTVVCLITCGVAAPWMICKLYKWKINHTTINGKRLVFTGSGSSLLGSWILWEILTAVTCGIYGFFLHVALRKWELKHTFIEGEPISSNGKESYFDGGSFVYFGYGVVATILLIVSCGIAYPWVMAMLQKWDTKHQVISNRRLVFSGTGLGFLGEFIIIFVLSIITLGIYIPWGIVRMNKYIIRNTDFVA